MRDKTIVALYDRFENAQAAVDDLIQAGAPRERIALLANNAGATHTGLTSNPAFAREDFNSDTDGQSGVVTGAEVGIGLGGALGLLVGVGTIAIPGIGALIAAGALATVAAGAAAGGVVGGVIGALTDHGVTDADAHLYAEGLKRGGTLVTSVVGEDKIDTITQIFKNHGAVDIEKRGSSWNAEGWVRFDPAGSPLSAAELAVVQAAGEGHEAEHHHAVRHYFHPDDDVGTVGGGATNVGTHYAEDVIKP